MKLRVISNRDPEIYTDPVDRDFRRRDGIEPTMRRICGAGEAEDRAAAGELIFDAKRIGAVADPTFVEVRAEQSRAARRQRAPARKQALAPPPTAST